MTQRIRDVTISIAGPPFHVRCCPVSPAATPSTVCMAVKTRLPNSTPRTALSTAGCLTAMRRMPPMMRTTLDWIKNEWRHHLTCEHHTPFTIYGIWCKLGHWISSDGCWLGRILKQMNKEGLCCHYSQALAHVGCSETRCLSCGLY